MGDRFDEVHERARHEALARELKFGVTDANGWQTVYGYDNGASRARFERSVAELRANLRAARRTLDEPRELALLDELNAEFDRFLNLDRIAYRELRNGRTEQVKRVLLGPELDISEAIAATAERLARYEERRARATQRAFDDARDDARRRLTAVALGAGLVIVLLLVTAWDVARLALEGAKHREPPRARR
jgi:hypothetical protein